MIIREKTSFRLSCSMMDELGVPRKPSRIMCSTSRPLRAVFEPERVESSHQEGFSSALPTAGAMCAATCAAYRRAMVICSRFRGYSNEVVDRIYRIINLTLRIREAGMEKENWNPVEAAQIIQLNDGDRRLLDHVQGQLDLNDSDFRHFLVLIGKIAPSAARLNAVRSHESGSTRGRNSRASCPPLSGHRTSGNPDPQHTGERR